MYEIEKITKYTHILFYDENINEIIPSLNLFPINKLIIIKKEKSIIKLDIPIDSRIEIEEIVINDDSFFQKSIKLMKLLLFEIMNNDNDIYLNITNLNDFNIPALFCSQFSGLRCYSLIYNELYEKFEANKLEYMPLLPVINLSHDGFELISIINFILYLKEENIIEFMKNNIQLHDFFFPNLIKKNSFDEILTIIEKNTTIINSEKYIRSLDKLVFILNPEFKNKDKKYYSERARLSYHLNKFNEHNLLILEKDKRNRLISTSWIARMFFLGEIIKKLKKK